MKKFSLYLMAALYVFAGINHFYNPTFYQAIMPCYVGYHILLIYLSGVCEIALGLLLLPYSTRKIASILIILMLTIFLWLHIQMLIDYRKSNNPLLWLAIVRIPIQFVLIWWAYILAKQKNNHKNS